MLSKWITGINDQEKFTSRIFYTVREMFTLVKNQLHDVPTSQEAHALHEVISTAGPPNFNAIAVNNAKQKLRAASASEQRKVGYYT